MAPFSQKLDGIHPMSIRGMLAPINKTEIGAALSASSASIAEAQLKENPTHAQLASERATKVRRRNSEKKR
eukprot:IDg19482t1